MLVFVFVLVFVPARVVCGALMSILVFEFMVEARGKGWTMSCIGVHFCSGGNK